MSKQLLISIILFISIIFFSGCTAGVTEPEIDFKPPKYVEQMPSKEGKKDFISQGSIFGQGDNPLFSDHKAMNVNDIVRVTIAETANSTNTGTKQLSEDDTTSLGGLIISNNGVPSSSLSGLNTSIASTTANAYNGAGSATKNASFSTTVSARVVKVLENGNYFISGKREILVDEQKQIIQISGVIRPYDIDQFNSINSDQMSDAKILYKSEGDVDRATQQGWGTKIIQAAWPF